MYFCFPDSGRILLKQFFVKILPLFFKLFGNNIYNKGRSTLLRGICIAKRFDPKPFKSTLCMRSIW